MFYRSINFNIRAAVVVFDKFDPGFDAFFNLLDMADYAYFTADVIEPRYHVELITFSLSLESYKSLTTAFINFTLKYDEPHNAEG